ncbi:hypothetical protein O6P43_020320 [Quillaja saponaria]|uniref:Uncharacterized protein n=1 Tax=Quillaja saponaria TaxID=32244 RepID=A0AAD7PM61_QUISA|nr:hypothetical protein O6P43_020320 [Quillaja saponaria]
MEEAGHEGEGGGGGGGGSGGVDGVYWYGNNNVKANPNPPTMYIPVGPPLTTIDRFSWGQQNQYLSKQQQIHENKEAASVSANGLWSGFLWPSNSSNIVHTDML